MASEFTFLSAQTAVEPTRAPAWPAFAAGGCALVASTLALLGRDNATLASVGYLLGAIGVPALVVMYRFGRRSAAQNPFYVPRLTIERLVLASLVIGILAGGVNAWFVATELAKQ